MSLRATSCTVGLVSEDELGTKEEAGTEQNLEYATLKTSGYAAHTTASPRDITVEGNVYRRFLHAVISTAELSRRVELYVAEVSGWTDQSSTVSRKGV